MARYFVIFFFRIERADWRFIFNKEYHGQNLKNEETIEKIFIIFKIYNGIVSRICNFIN